MNPVVGYTAGHVTELTALLQQSANNLETMDGRIARL